MNAKSQDFNDLAADEVSTFVCDGAFLFLESAFREQMYLVASHHGLPIQSVRFVQNFFGLLRTSIYPG